MTEYPYILFNKSPEQLRHLGACGGRAYGRNQRARRALVAAPPEAVPPLAVSWQTAAEAIHLLDTQFSVAARCGKVTPDRTGAPAAPWWRPRRKPCRHSRCHGKRPPKPSTFWTPSFPWLRGAER